MGEWEGERPGKWEGERRGKRVGGRVRVTGEGEEWEGEGNR